jgi:signal peptidase
MVGCALVAAFLLDNLVLGPKIGGTLGSYLLPAIMWALLIILLLRVPSARIAGKLRLRRLLYGMALIAVFIAIFAVLLEGVFFGFGKSPYDHSLLGIIINLLYEGTALIAFEITRSWLVNRFFRRRAFLDIAGISLLFTFLLLPLNRLFNLQGAKELTEFVGASLFPGLAENILTTYLAFWGGPVPAIIYRGGLLVFERLSPLLPNGENWVMAALIGTLVPLVTLILIQQIYKEESREAKPSRQETGYLPWAGAGLASILIIWFCLGVFSYSPRVILSGSMVPVMNIGDVAILHTIPGSEAKLRDIVMFPVGSMKVTHRIIDVEKAEEGRYFTTKGDANGEPESDLLAEQDVQGKVVMIIPKLGYLTLWLRGAWN